MSFTLWLTFQAISIRANVSGPLITKECFTTFVSIKMCSFYLQNADLLGCSDHKPLLKILTRHIDKKKCNTRSLETTAIHRHVRVEYIKGIANVLADYVSRLRAICYTMTLTLGKVNRNSVHHLNPCLLLSKKLICL